MDSQMQNIPESKAELPIEPTSLQKTPILPKKPLFFLISLSILFAIIAISFLSTKKMGTQTIKQPASSPAPLISPASEPTEAIVTPKPINSKPTITPKSENEFYQQVGNAFKGVF